MSEKRIAIIGSNDESGKTFTQQAIDYCKSIGERGYRLYSYDIKQMQESITEAMSQDNLSQIIISKSIMKLQPFENLLCLLKEADKYKIEITLFDDYPIQLLSNNMLNLAVLVEAYEHNKSILKKSKGNRGRVGRRPIDITCSIEELLNAGSTYKEIAFLSQTSPATICRRVKEMNVRTS